MIFRRGSQATWGELTGFPKTGTRMEWLTDGERTVQRGFYRSDRHQVMEEIYERAPWRSARLGGRVYSWPRAWRYW